MLTNDELRAIWNATALPLDLPDGVSLSAGMAMAIRVAIVTLQRGGEVCGLNTRELDLQNGLWTIPDDRTKNHRTHTVPLSPLAVETISEAIRLSNAPDGFVFSSPTAQGHITRRAFSRAVKRLTTALSIDDVTAHDFRRTGSTNLTDERCRVPRFHVSCVLNHASDTGGAAAVTAVYDRNEYLVEKRRALEKWADRLAEIVSDDAEKSNVTFLR